MQGTPLLHIASWHEWEARPNRAEYHAPSLETEGFIHLSSPAQVLGPANALYRGQTNLVLLVIDSGKLISDVRWEDLYGHGAFPHLYGPLNADAVVQVVDFPCQSDGTFALPTEWVELAHAR